VLNVAEETWGLVVPHWKAALSDGTLPPLKRISNTL